MLHTESGLLMAIDIIDIDTLVDYLQMLVLLSYQTLGVIDITVDS